MAWFMDTVSVQTGYTVTGVVTGKPVSLGGSQGRAGATSRGVQFITLEALAHRGQGARTGVDRRGPGLRQGRRARRAVPARSRLPGGRGLRRRRRRAYSTG